MKRLKISLCAVLSCFIGVWCAEAQDHGHLRIGARSTAPGTPLYFVNGADFASTNGYVKTLTFTNSGRYAEYYQQNITFTVQAATPDAGGPEPDPPALGSWIWARILSVQGPAGGAFGFWEAGATTPTIGLGSGETGTNSFKITLADGSPGTDPFGHIHGRRFTATKPGIYVVTFQAYDASVNGTDGGPIHMSTEPIQISFQAGVNVQVVEARDNRAVIRLGAMAGLNWQLEAADSLDPQPMWQEIGAPITGDDYFHNVTGPYSPQGHRIYRVRAVSP